VSNSSNFSHTNAQIIKCTVISDKATALLDNNKYSFRVDRSCDKITIKNAIESLLNVKVVKINTCNLPIKRSDLNQKYRGYTPKYKKAIVTLAEGDVISLFPDN